jgi:hypothetical protein
MDPITYTDVKKIFALLPIKTLRDLAQKHNVMNDIKAPSSMLKAELVNSLSEYYKSLTGTNFMPIQSKPLSISINDLPMKYKPKKIIANETPLQKWAREFIRVMPRKQEIQAENRAKKYETDKKLKEAIKKREQNQAKQKAYREKLKNEDKTTKQSKKVKKTQEDNENDEIISNNKYVIELQEILKNYKKLKKMPENKAGKDLYNFTYNRYRTIEDAIKKDKNINTVDSKIIDKLDKEIYTLSEDDDILDKFFY